MIRSLLATLLTATAPSVAFTIGDPRIDEASGIAPGLRSPGVVYVQNDSGDTNRFFALNARTGATVATVRVPGASNIDWEDVAVATDAAGTPSVWLADTGDNDAGRDEVHVYRVDEPRLDPGTRDRVVSTGRPDVWRLRYPGGPVDVESLAVMSGGAAYLVTKSFAGRSVVYRLPTTPGGNRVQTPTRIADLAFTFTGTPGGPNAIGQLTATGAAFSRDGNTFAVRTYTDAYLWAVRDGDLAGALRVKPVRIALPAQPQGEGMAIVGDHLLVDSEGVDQPVYSLPLPRTPPAAPPTPFDPTSAADSLRRGSTALTFDAGPDDGERGASGITGYVVGGAVIVLGAVVLTVALFSRRRH